MGRFSHGNFKGKLVGKGGVSTSGEGVRKRLKVSVPHFDNSDLIKSYAMTLIGRCMNPEAQKISALLVMIPKIWKVEERVTGADLGKGMFQFHFEKEEDIEAVLESQPYHFDYWMISLARWQPRMSRTFPSEIPFWIKVDGLPTEFWSTPTFQSIGDAIGETTDVDLDYGKMRVVLDGFKELTLETTVEFKGGEFYDEEEVPVSLKYEKLFGFCKLCFSLCHDEDHCPLNPKSPEKKKDNREELAGRGEDRARSYRGVVINGEENHQENGKEQRSYYGKGKGKMHEDESNWVRVPQRGNKRSSSYRGRSRADEGNTRHRSSRWEPPRNNMQESRDRGHRDTRCERSHLNYVREESKEEGELQDTGSVNMGLQREGKTSASNIPQLTQQELNGGYNNLVKVISKTAGVENGATTVTASEKIGTGSEMAQKQDGLGVDSSMNEGMDLDDIGNHIEGDEGLMCDEDGWQNLTDGETEDQNVPQEGELGIAADVSHVKEAGEKGSQVGEEDKKKGTRKFKQTVMAAGTSKKKFVQALLSQNKNVQPRQGKRQGEGIRLQEEKGPSNPKLTSSKHSNASHG
ncbi:hypothetical protein BRARA_B02584 [Brassica rapa]|uniref:DUF4283 domain-containing protein n=1 Tax=Brassica campestris TaxID=3711 RepID=A0A398AFZ7_BRACM|nr:hypothetical protein BRARA_B02584 [Brassica rapa]